MRGYDGRIVAGYVPRLEAGLAGGEVAPMDPTVLAWALMAVGEMAGPRWILWEAGRPRPDDVFEQVMTVAGRMLAGATGGQQPDRRSE